MTSAEFDQGAATATVTAVIGHVARPGVSKRQVRRRLERLIDRGARFPGYLRGDIQAPDPRRLDDWVVVVEFMDSATLTGWLTSAARAELLDGEPKLFSGRPRVQVLATPNSATSVTAVASFPVEPGLEEAFEAQYRRLLAAVIGFDGFIRCELIPAEHGIQRDCAVVFSFTSRQALDVWFESDQRSTILADVRPLLTSETTMNIVGGFGGWFNPPNRPPKMWKQACLVLIALYPTSLLLSWLRLAAFPDLPFAAAVLVVNVLGVAVLTWILLPTLTGRFWRWLRR